MSVPYFDSTGIRLGTCSKPEVHKHGHWHRTALILAVRQAEVLVITRGEHQSYAGCRDLLGGHEDETDGGDLRATCIREASEELHVHVGGKPFKIGARDFLLIGSEGSMLVDLPHNKERSSVYGLLLPDAAEVQVFDFDDDEQRNIQLESEFRQVAALLKDHSTNPEFAADGLRRVLEAIESDPQFSSAVEAFTTRRKWTICFADSYPDEPGTGGPDNDYYAEYEHFGSRREAEREAREISFERYRGDFVWWLKEAR
ncbi:MAG: hypothetical protein ACK5Q5_12500 [Planctomycetaceae bacterium]